MKKKRSIKIRRTWSINPKTKVKDSAKIYKRNIDKLKGREDIDNV